MQHVARVFLSHANSDKPAVRRIAEALRAAGHHPWLDEEQIIAGESILLAVERGLCDSDFVVVCLSKAAADSGWVDAERAAACMQQFHERRERMIPVRLEDVAPPLLAASLAYVDLFPDEVFRDGMAQLARSLEEHEARRPQSNDAGAVSPQIAVNTQRIAGLRRQSKEKKVALSKPAYGRAGVGQEIETSSVSRLSAWGTATAFVVATAIAIYVGMPTHPTLRVDSVVTKHLTPDPDEPQQVLLILMGTVIDGKLGDKCFVQVSENSSFEGPRGDVLEEKTGVVEGDDVECEPPKWDFPFQLSKRPHINFWRGWVRIALRRGNRIFESDSVKVEVTAKGGAPTHARRDRMQ